MPPIAANEIRSHNYGMLLADLPIPDPEGWKAQQR